MSAYLELAFALIFIGAGSVTIWKSTAIAEALTKDNRQSGWHDGRTFSADNSVVPPVKVKMVGAVLVFFGIVALFKHPFG